MNKPDTDPRELDPFFFCVSLNPAIDTRLVLDKFEIGHVNRASEVHRTPGGKAAHVAMALQALGANPKWIGFAGGATGNELIAGLHRLKITAVPVPTAQSTRVNLEIIDIHGGITEILEPGGTIAQSEWSEFQKICATEFQRMAGRKIVLISGSQPPGVPAEASAVLLKLAQSSGCLAFLDTSSPTLAKALAAGPDFVKVNREEAQSVTGIAVSDPASSDDAVRKLLDRGAKSAAISLGDRGIVGIKQRDDPAMQASTTPLRAKSTVGCGDSALAGFAFAAGSGLSFERCLSLAVACGAANCLAQLPARIKQADVARFETGVLVEPVLKRETAR
ncbi:MAG TPA: 1-phosphofructokinase family hexose kinase [Candidatus Acidoferrum sp.]|nr:1-phosphofructokinase family hexose kinase [Candidatus Acidoferrum sp.]